MFCKMCGTKLEEGWAACPKCGARIERKENQSQKTMEVAQERSEISDKGKSKISAGIVLRILAIIAVVCFFCPLYMVSCAGEEVAQITGTNLMFGMECMGRQIEGNLGYGFLVVVLIIGALISFSNHKELERTREYKTVKELYCTSAVLAGVALVLIWYFTQVLQKNVENTVLEISLCLPLYIMKIACVMSVLIGGYNSYLSGVKEIGQLADASDKIVEAITCGGKILFQSVVGFIIVVTISHYLKIDMPMVEENGTYGQVIEDSGEISGDFRQPEEGVAKENFEGAGEWEDWKENETSVIGGGGEDGNHGMSGGETEFIEWEGTYITANTMEEYGGMTGKIEVYEVDRECIIVELGFLDGPSEILTEYAQIINENSAQMDLYGFIITFTWTAEGDLYVTNEGELSGMDSETIFDLTNNQSYIKPYEFNQW